MLRLCALSLHSYARIDRLCAAQAIDVPCREFYRAVRALATLIDCVRLFSQKIAAGDDSLSLAVRMHVMQRELAMTPCRG